MRIPRLKFVWSGAREIRGRWYLGLFGFYDRVAGERDGGLAISVRGLLWWMSGALVAGYFAAAGALYWLWQRNPYSVLTYGDALLYPVRRGEVSAKQGRAYIAEGLELWRNKKHGEASSLLRQGLARYPRDFRARMVLAEFYSAVNRRPMAVEILQGGLTDEFPGRAYLQALFSAAEQMENYALIADVAQRYHALVLSEEHSRDRQWLEERRFAALIAAEKFDDALAMADATLAVDVAGERAVLALLAAKRPDDAAALLLEWRKRPGANPEIVTRLEVRVFREAQRFAEMDRAIAELRRMTPTSPAPAAYGIVQLAMAGRMDAAEEALADYIFRFGGTPAHLLMVAEPLGSVSAVQLVERCRGAAAERGHPLAAFDTWLVEANVQLGEWATASRILEAMPPPAARDAVSGQLWREWMRRVLAVTQASTEADQVELITFMRQRLWPIRLFRRTIEALMRAERWAAARDVAAMAATAFPTSAWVRQRGEEVGRELDKMRASEPVAAAASERGLSETTFFSQLEAAMGAKRWEEAAELIAQARDVRPRPAWLETRDPELRLAQTRIGHERGSLTEMLAAARVYLNGSNERSGKMLELAREIYVADRSHAIELAREVRRKTPDYPPVQRLWAEWQPRPTAP